MAATVITYDPNEWRQDAACRDLDTAIFFPETEEEFAAALADCAASTVRDSCLEFALVTRQDDGVWGGMTETDRKRRRRRRQEAARRRAA